MSSTFAIRNRPSKGGLVTIGIVVALIVAMAVTLFGTGAADNALASFDASSWLFSKGKGEVARVNGVTGKVDTRTKITDSQGHTMQVTQNDRYVFLRDLNTGRVSVLDLSNLQIGATTQTTPGLGVTVALHDGSAFVVDAVQGVVRQLDPGTLAPIGQPLSFPPGISGGQFDSDGRLWLLVPSEGTAVAVKPTSSGKPAAEASTPAAAAGSPTITSTVSVADPSHELILSVLDKGIAVLDRTSTTLITVEGDDEQSIGLTLRGPGALPPRTVGDDIPVTVVDDRKVYVVNGDKVTEFVVPGENPRLQPCTAWSRRLYCPDDATGNVYVLDAKGQLVSTVSVPNNGAPLELEVREEHLFINAPDTANARVVDDSHKVKPVNKYANDVAGSEPPPVTPPTPPTPPSGPPGAPTEVKATAGNTLAHLSWGAAAPNGHPIMKYVIEGEGKTREVGANQRSLDITGLTNGQKYTFTIHAVNAKGPGPKRQSNPVVPTAEVPDPPASVTAADKPDGTVVVTWPAANGQGNAIARYDITAISAGQWVPVGSATGTTFTVPTGKLDYGTQVAFAVTSVTDKGASSTASVPSNTVVPYNKPAAPSVTAAMDATQKGAVTVRWAAPADNGRPITKYIVAAGTVTKEVTGATSTTLTGLANGQTVTVKVQAVNEAGAGAEGRASAATIKEPAVSGVSSTATATELTVRFTADTGGASGPTCSVTVSGKAAVTGACSSITVGSLLPGTAYEYTVTVANPAGKAEATGSQTTQTITGVAYCEPPAGTTDSASLKWCDSGDNALEVQTDPSKLYSGQVGRTNSGSTYKAYCYTTGDEVYAYKYNNEKRTNIWVKIEWNGGQYYTPLAWFNVNNNNSVYTGALPHC